MVAVSDKYKALATAAGREVSCVIEAGGFVFYDSDIISFELEDIIHDEEMAFGSTASSRFHFELKTEKFIPLSAVIKPYITFAGSVERCPLGVFYIAKRYRRQNRYSITCYDGMYRLDDEYETSLVFPASAKEVMDELCAVCGIESDAVCGDFSCDSRPEQATFRDVIGYIAGLHGASARFGRNGRLCFKTLSDCGFTILRDNYFSATIKQDPCVVEEIDVRTQGEEFKAGDGTKLTAYAVYNPLGNQLMADRLLEQWYGFFYYGMQIEMQGLPFLEAGDSVMVQNDADDTLFPAIISALEFSYNGALSCTLYSKSKNPIDDYENAGSEALQLEAAVQALTVVNCGYTNKIGITVTSELTRLINMDVSCTKSGDAVFLAQIPVIARAECVLTLYIMQDGAELKSFRTDLSSGQNMPLCIHYLFNSLKVGSNNIRVYGKTNNAAVYTDKNAISATLFGQNVAALSENRSPNRTISENFASFSLSARTLSFSFAENKSVMAQSPISYSLSEATALSSAPFVLSTNFSDKKAGVGSVPNKLTMNNYNQLTLTMSNPVTLSGELPHNAFRLIITQQGETSEKAITAVTKAGEETLKLTPELFVGCDAAELVYDAAGGTLCGVYDGAAVNAFRIAAELAST